MKVTYKEHMGSDLEVVNAARVSFSGESEWGYKTSDGRIVPNDNYTKADLEGRGKHGKWCERNLKPKDKHLIKFLARGCTTKDWDNLLEEVVTESSYIVGGDWETKDLQKLLNHVKRMPSHWVPFANGGHIKMHFKVPLFVARQLQKHTAGFNPWSEVSRRYVDSTPEFYVPDVWRGRSADKKQGSTGVVAANMNIPEIYTEAMSEVVSKYKDMLEYGVAPEQARMVLPQSMYVELIWAGNLFAWSSLFNTRSWGDSQAETANVAQQIKAIVEPLFPVSWKELTQ